MISCPSCNSTLAERALYCHICGVQAKCRECQDVLDANAQFCISCGTAIIKGQTSVVKNIATDSYNVIEFDEDRKSRRLRVQVSDTAMESVSHTLSSFLGTQLSMPRKQKHLDNPAYLTNGQVIIPDIAKDTAHTEHTESNITDSRGGENSLPVKPDLEVLRKIFRVTSDNKLKLSDSRLKQSNQSDFVRRLTVLFLFAHELEGREAVPRADLNLALTDAKVYDSNSRAWIANTDLVDRDNDSVRLALPGRDSAQKVLKEYTDANIETKWTFESKARTRPRSQDNSQEWVYKNA